MSYMAMINLYCFIMEILAKMNQKNFLIFLNRKANYLKDYSKI